MIKIPTGKEVPPEHWDEQNGKIRKTFHLSTEINVAIRSRMEEFQRFMLKQEATGKPISKDTVKDFFNNRTNLTFYQFWEQQVSLWKTQKKHNTIRGYNAVLNVLKEFRSTLQFNEINLHLIEQFDVYLREERKITINGAFGNHKCFKAIIRASIKKGYLEKDPYADFRIRSEDSKRVFLIAEELRILTTLQIEQQKIPGHLEKTRDAFLFSCYSGIRFSDMEDLKWNNISGHSISLMMNKTGKEVNIALIPQTRAILDKYLGVSGESPENRVFEMVMNQKSNKSLKKLTKLAGIDKNITFHCARHTFASLLLSCNTNILNIKDLLGHSSVSQTEIYAKSIKKDLSEAMNRIALL
jgi:integrase/recombinase XerD